MEPVTTPHDKLFRQTWSNREEAREFLRSYLPEAVLRLIDLDSLEICKDSFIDTHLKTFFSDLLYKVTLGEAEGYVYILFEHKSYSAPDIHLQMLEYMLKIWRLHRKQEKISVEQQGARTRLPVIIPLVLHHGKPRWTVSRVFSDLFEGVTGDLRPYIPDFEYLLYDLTDYTDADIRGTVVARVVMLLFKHVHDTDFLKHLEQILVLLNELPDRETLKYWVFIILRYVVSVTNELNDKEVTEIAEHALGGDVMMTIAEKWKEEGEKKGYERGLVEAIELGLRVKFGEETVNTIMPVVQATHDLTSLKTIKDALLKVRDSAELQQLIGSLREKTV